MHKRPLIASVLRVMVEAFLEPFCPVPSTLARSLQCPLQWSDLATLIDSDFRNVCKTNSQLKECEAARQESVAALTRICIYAGGRFSACPSSDSNEMRDLQMQKLPKKVYKKCGQEMWHSGILKRHWPRPKC